MVTKKPNSNSTVYDGSSERESLYKELLNFHIKLDIYHMKIMKLSFHCTWHVYIKILIIVYLLAWG